MSKKIISIAIPAYNGSRTIANTLDSIIQNVSQIENVGEQLEIVLIDDCSSDDTFLIISEYSKKYKYIKVFKNSHNLGMDGNFKQTALNGSGDYIWFSGQDDIFLPGSVEYILRAIKNNSDLGIININFSQYSEDKAGYICESMFDQQSIRPDKINYNQDLVFNNAKEYFGCFNDVPSFLPAIVMKRDFWLTTNTDKFIGTHFIQYATILLNINSAKILAVTRPLIRGLIPAAGWQTNGNKLFTIQLGMMKARSLVFGDSRNAFPPQIFYAKKRFYFKRFLRMVIAAHYYGFIPSSENKADLQIIYGRGLYYLYFLPILIIIGATPRFIIKTLFLFKKFFNY